MRARIVVALAALLVVASVGSLQAAADDDDDGRRRFRASLTGYEEVPTLSVPGTGSFVARLTDDGSISYRLRYTGLTGDALFAHIHLGMPATAGGVIAFLCDSADTAPDGVEVPECPGDAGTVTGTIEASDVIGPADQGIASGEFDELVAAMRFGATYANVHTQMFQSGEIRGQIR